MPDHDETGAFFAFALFELGEDIEATALGQWGIVDLQLIDRGGDSLRGWCPLLFGLGCSRFLSSCIDY
jgi:hypothetical protein